jgi:hypothetical protein
MRLPGPIDVRSARSRVPIVAVTVVAAVAVVGGVVWASRSGSEVLPDGSDAPGATPVGDGANGPAQGSGTSSSNSAPPSGAQALASSVISTLPTPARLLDTRPGQTTVDGQFAGIGVVGPGATLELVVADRVAAAAPSGLVSLTVNATAGPDRSELVVQPCGHEGGAQPSLTAEAGTTVTRNLVVPIGANGAICLLPTAAVDVVVDLDAFVDQGAVRPFPAPVPIVDSTAGGSTADGAFAAIGVRPDRSTLRVPVTSRFTGLADTGALMVSVSSIGAFEPGEGRVFAPESAVPTAPQLTYAPGEITRSTAIVPLGVGGELCVSTTGRTDIVVELLALVPSSVSSPIEAAAPTECPGQTMFPDRRIVALYGTQRSARLGALGEQDPAASATRLDEVAEPWRAGDRPVLPAFELIATLATGTPEDLGTYNIRADSEFVQEYLDVARRHGYYLILDIQPGQSDFLTEAQYYEEFLRQPDVGIALDPEWRTAPPARPRGGFVGQVDASEVNAVVDYVARLVAEEDLPEKLVVVHQFQDRMITNRDQLREQPGVALTIHMDGFGDRPNKLDSYDVVRIEPPINMGLKLFYDEDIDLLGATEVLGGLFDPVPDLISYQ